MNTLKKLFSLCLALMLVLSLAVPALAVNEMQVEGNDNFDYDDTPKYTITINGNLNNTNENSQAGHTYEAYRILKGHYAKDEQNQVVLSSPQWETAELGTALLEALQNDKNFGEGTGNYFSSVETVEKFVEQISLKSFSTAQKEELAHVIHKVVSDLKMEPVASTTEPAPPYTMTVPAGYYLIKDKDESLDDQKDKDYTDAILQVSADVNLYHKGTVPTVTKEVSDTTSGFGEVAGVAIAKDHYYQLTGTLPQDLLKFEKYTYVFEDTLSEGLDFVEIEKVYIPRDDNNNVEIADTTNDPDNESGYKWEYDETTHKLTITLKDLLHDNNAHGILPRDTIMVLYRVKLNEDAVIGYDGNANSVVLKYSNNPNTQSMGVTHASSTKVYTYGIKVHKHEGGTDKALEGAKFVLYRDKRVTSDGVTTTVPEYAVINDEGFITDWTTYAHDAKDVPEGEKNATEVATDENGILVIYGLDSNIGYFLEETATPSALYNLLTEPIDLRLTGTLTDGVISSVVCTTESQDCNIGEQWTETKKIQTENGEEKEETIYVGINLIIPNYKGAVLPSTGGIGTTIFYIAGAVLVLGAIAMLVTKKRMS